MILIEETRCRAHGIHPSVLFQFFDKSKTVLKTHLIFLNKLITVTLVTALYVSHVHHLINTSFACKLCAHYPKSGLRLSPYI